MAQDEFGNEIDDQQQQGTTSQVAQAAGTGVAAPPKPKSSNENASSWLNWISSTYGDSKSRGGGFADTNDPLSSVVDRFNRDTGGQAKLVPGASGDMVDFGNGARDVKTAEGQLWYNYGPGGPPGQKPSSGGGGGGGGSAFGSGGGGTGFLGDSGGKSNALYDLLMKRAQQSATIDRNDPNIRAQSDAFNAQGQQARRDYLASEAEKAGAYGNQRSEERRSAEELGKSSGAFEAQAIKQAQDARRSEIESALSGAAGFLTEQQRMALQEELSKIQLNQQESQFGRSQSQQASQFGAGLGQRAYEFDTNRYDSMFL